MPSSDQIARGHLRLASLPESRRGPDRHAALVARALVASVVLAWLSLAGWLAAVVALLPLLWRGAPIGRRLRPPAQREARIIPFQPRRQALPR